MLEARGVTMTFDRLKAIDDATVEVREGEILGLIGPNGAGKSTLFNCLTGDLTPTAGTVRLRGQDVTHLPPEARAALGIARSFQVPLTFEGMSVLENVMIGAFIRTASTSEARERARAVIGTGWACAARRRRGTQPRHTRPKAARNCPCAGY